MGKTKGTELKLTIDSSPALIKYYISEKGLTQTILKSALNNVSDAAISKAINNHPHMHELRKRIIDLLNKDKKSIIQICNICGKKIIREKIN